MYNNYQQALRPQNIQACQPRAPKQSTTRQPPGPVLEDEHRCLALREAHSKVKRGKAIGHHWNWKGLRKLSGLLLLLMMSILGVVQGLTDCQIMEDWLPTMFDGVGTACCLQSGITCNVCTLIDGEIICGSGRITQM
jgi:hypothetical protein